MSSSKSRGSRCRTSSISATSRFSVPQHRPHVRPGLLRLDSHPLGDPADELISARGRLDDDLALVLAQPRLLLRRTA
jgi:hypothetical protein